MNPLRLFLDSAVRWLLPWLDAHTMALLSLLIACLGACWRRWKDKRWPSGIAFLAAFGGLLIITTGATVSLVLLFTWPIAVEAISAGTAPWIGAVIIVGSWWSGRQGLRYLFRPQTGSSIDGPNNEEPSNGQEHRHG